MRITRGGLLCVYTVSLRGGKRTKRIGRFLKAAQKSAEGIVSPADGGDEGLNMKLRERDLVFDGEEDADNKR